MIFMTNFNDQLLHIQRKFKRTVKLYAVFRFALKKKRLANSNIIRCEPLKKPYCLKGENRTLERDLERNATKPGVVVHSFNPVLRRQRRADLCDLDANLAYKKSSGSFRTVVQDRKKTLS